MVKFVPAVAYHFCLALPAAFTQPGDHLLAEPCILTGFETETIHDDCICREYKYQPEKMTWDPHCYECKVRYRDPKPKDLVMYLHAWRYKVRLQLKVQ